MIKHVNWAQSQRVAVQCQQMNEATKILQPQLKNQSMNHAAFQQVSSPNSFDMLFNSSFHAAGPLLIHEVELSPGHTLDLQAARHNQAEHGYNHTLFNERMKIKMREVNATCHHS
jgi:hypothetical protein